MPEAHRRYARGLRRRRLDGNNRPATQSQQMRGFHAEVVHHGEQIFRLCRDVETQRVQNLFSLAIVMLSAAYFREV